MIHFRVRYERLASKFLRLRRRTALVRAVWLGLLGVLAWTAWYAASGVAPTAVLLLLAPVVSAGAFIWGARASGIDLSRWLDRRFGLHELLVTAVEVDQRGPRSAVEARLLDDAATALTVLRDEPGLMPRSTRREAETALAIAMMCAGLWLLGMSSRAATTADRLPDLAVQPLGGSGDAFGAEGGAGATRGQGSGSSSEMQSVAAHLNDLASARAIAEALAAGDPWSAARAARALADYSGSMSAGGRRDLADALHAAADAAEDGNQGLAEALRRAGRAFESPDVQQGAAGVEQLAAELDAMASSGAASGAGQLRPEAESRTGPPSPRLVVTAEAAPLDRNPAPGTTRGSVGSAGAESLPNQEAAPSQASFVSGGATSSPSGASGPDALAYPWAMREALRRYFSRPGTGP